MASKKHTVITRPMVHRDRLLVEQVGDESVIFDLRTRASHALKPLAAAVFTYADGTHTIAEIAELVGYRLATLVTEDDVTEVVAQLSDLDLLDAPDLDLGHGLSRRDALKTFAAVGAGAALISTVTAGTAMASSATNAQLALGDDQMCGTGSSNVMIPGTGHADSGSSYTDYVFPQPGVTTYTIDGHEFTGLAGGASYGFTIGGSNNPNAVNPADYGGSCVYLKYNGGGTNNCSNYTEETGKWQCVPCDGTAGYECCQVVCAPAGYGYSWGSTATPPSGYEYPYEGCGTNSSSGHANDSCPHPGSPDYTTDSYYGKYCTPGGGQPKS